jgi:cell division transport system permease protein
MSRSKNKPFTRAKLSNEGFIGRLNYFIRRAILNLRQNIFVSLLTIGTISLALLLISLFLLVYVNLEGLAESWSEKVQVTAFFDRELTQQESIELKSRVQALNGTERAIYVTKDEAMKRFRARLKGQESLLEGVSAEVLPSSLEITLKKENRSSESVDAYVAGLKKVQGISEVQYGEEWLRRFNTFMNFMRLVGTLLGGFLVLAVLFIVSNTIKLTIYARRDELEVLGLVGATRFFIKAPFLIEGIFQGAVGAALALVILTLCYFGFLHNAGNFLSFNPAATGLSFLPVTHLVTLFFAGIVVGFLGSLTSLKRFITI